MTGVEILSQTEVATGYSFNTTVALIVFGVIMVAGALLLYWAYQATNDSSVFMVLFLVFIIAVISGVLVGGVYNGPSTYETRYKVIIDDSVSMNEFLSKYEIIDQEGKIYTVRERNEQ